jgi:hypothetical protein
MVGFKKCRSKMNSALRPRLGGLIDAGVRLSLIESQSARATQEATRGKQAIILKIETEAVTR